jgi:hypothetical protein
MLSIVGIYSFLGPMAAAAFGGYFNVAFSSCRSAAVFVYAASAVGLVVLPVFMGFMGRELRSWARPDDSHLESVVVTTLMPWLFGTLHVLLI